MEHLDSITIEQARLPAGRSFTAEELDRSERALHTLLCSYVDEELLSDLRIRLKAEAEKEYCFCTNAQLLQASDLYSLIAAAKLLEQYLGNRILKRLELRAAGGDDEALADLSSITGT